MLGEGESKRNGYRWWVSKYAHNLSLCQCARLEIQEFYLVSLVFLSCIECVKQWSS